MTESPEQTPVFNYVVAIGGRELIVTLMQNKMSQWDDFSKRSLSEAVDDGSPRGLVLLPISDVIFEKALAMAERERQEEVKVSGIPMSTQETEASIREMDRLLEAFFWEKVNARLERPIISSGRAHEE